MYYCEGVCTTLRYSPATRIWRRTHRWVCRYLPSSGAGHVHSHLCYSGRGNESDGGPRFVVLRSVMIQHHRVLAESSMAQTSQGFRNDVRSRGHKKASSSDDRLLCPLRLDNNLPSKVSDDQLWSCGCRKIASHALSPYLSVLRSHCAWGLFSCLDEVKRDDEQVPGTWRRRCCVPKREKLQDQTTL